MLSINFRKGKMWHFQFSQAINSNGLHIFNTYNSSKIEMCTEKFNSKICVFLSYLH